MLFLDGGMGTMLQAAGMPAGVAPEKFCLANREALIGIQSAYAAAGADIITTCTFGASRFKLPPDMDVFEVNKTMAQIAREAANRGAPGAQVFIAGDVGPSGLFAKPLGDIEPRGLIEAFAAQIKGLAAGGADLIFVETQFDLAEARAAVVAAREVCDLPVMVSMTFEHGVSLTGSTPQIFAETMLNMGVDVVGTNCSLGPVEMLPVVESLLATSAPHVMAEPNAGLPELREGQTVFPLGPEGFAEKTAIFARAGVGIIGGCCGTTPEHIRALKKAVLALNPGRRMPPKSGGIYLTSRSSLVHIAADEPLAVIGERINPTGKPALAAQLQEGVFDEACRLADEQLAAGVSVLDVNAGAPMVDETAVLPALACLLTGRQTAPLSLDSSNPRAIAAALPYCPGSPLVNSISGEPGRMEILAPLCKNYGAPFILLPLMGARLPVRASERINIVEKLLAMAGERGISRRLVMVDILALAVSSKSSGGVECLEMARWCREQGLASTIGLSNISFGLPARDLLNAVFLCMAKGAALTSCIANPSAPRVREALDAMKALTGHDRDAGQFIHSYAAWKSGGIAQAGPAERENAASLYDTVLLGDKEAVGRELEKELASGVEPFKIVNDILIPAITEVGARYERREYFLPQLIRSAETMQAAFSRLRPLLEESRGPEKRPVIVMATVEGDIHDIGKNIVCLLLGNHGFEVIDAGKDVPADKIVACAERHGASIIGLSALMTTTMVRMEDTIKLLKERGLPMRVMVGGAAVTQAFADSIGADAYCVDAVSGVRAAKGFIEQQKAAGVS